MYMSIFVEELNCSIYIYIYIYISSLVTFKSERICSCVCV